MNHLWYLVFISLLISCSNNKGKHNSAEISFDGQPAAQYVKNDVHIVAFIYHRFGDDRYPSTNISTLNFEKQLNYLKDNHYNVLSLSDALKALKTPGKNDRIVVLTVDDAFQSFYRKGFPLLKKFNFPATLFINTETVGGKSYMTWEEIREVKKAGIEIGNHTHSHSFFLNLPEELRYEKFNKELKLTQELISQNLDGYVPEYFAYPYGEYDAKMVEIVKKGGFKAAMAQNSGVIHSLSDNYTLPRFPMSSYYSDLSGFIEKVNMNALVIQSLNPKQHFIDNLENPPLLELAFLPENFNQSSLQCFVQGGKCKLEKSVKDGLISLKIKSDEPLARRRTLYTLTIKDNDGKWYWFSHLWIMPEFD